jgi:hypothetical protein
MLVTYILYPYKGDAVRTALVHIHITSTPSTVPGTSTGTYSVLVQYLLSLYVCTSNRGSVQYRTVGWNRSQNLLLQYHTPDSLQYFLHGTVSTKSTPSRKNGTTVVENKNAYCTPSRCLSFSVYLPYGRLPITIKK